MGRPNKRKDSGIDIGVLCYAICKECGDYFIMYKDHNNYCRKHQKNKK